MLSDKFRRRPAVRGLKAALGVSLIASAPVFAQTTAPAQSTPREAIGHTASVSRRAATVDFDLSDGSRLSVSLAGGTVSVNGQSVGSYVPGGPFEKAWRAVLSKAGDLGTPELVYALRSLPPSAAGPEAREALTAIIAALPGIKRSALQAPPDVDALVAARQINVDSLNASINEMSQRITRDVTRGLIRQGLRSADGASFGLGRLATDVAGLFGTLVALASLGFGALFFVPQRLEVVADTVRRSPIRAFFAGLFAQPLLLPALVTLIIGLVLTVVGILVIPFAVIAFVLAVAAALVGGYLAVARVVGEIYVRRRGQEGRYTSGWSTYRYLVYGLAGLLLIWAPAILLRWVPVAGTILTVTALVFTWAMVTTGFGAAILSKAGAGTWALRRAPMPELSAEYLWTTSPARATEARRGTP